VARIIKGIREAWRRSGMNKPPKGIRRLLFPILRILLLAYAGFACILFIFQSRFVYFPMKDIEGTPEEFALRYEEVFFSAADGVKLHGWFVPANRSRGAVLFCHGNAGNISHRIPSVHAFNRLFLDTFIFDYRGYGKSEGKPTEAGTYLDAEAALEYLTNQRKIAPEKIVMFGRSLGGSVAAHLAAARTPAALIVESSFSSVGDLGAEMFPLLPVRIISRFDYNTREYVQKADCPVLVVHSRDDDLIPFRHGERIFEAASEPKEFLEITGSHNSGFMDSMPDYMDGLDTFISKYLGKPGDPE
jgi:fermentation-respiration switch protein FrsA (DUF1100 family)